MNTPLKPSLESLRQEIEIATRKLSKDKLTSHHRFVTEQAIEIFKEQIVKFYGHEALDSIHTQTEVDKCQTE